MFVCVLGSGRKREFKGVHVKQLFYLEWWAGGASADRIVVRVMFLILIKRCALIFWKMKWKDGNAMGFVSRNIHTDKTYSTNSAL